MKKKVVAVLTTLAVSILTVVPAFASATSTLAAAQATQDARNAKVVSEKQRMADFAASELAKGENQKAVGQTAYQAGQEALAAFKTGELAKGENQKAAGQAAYQAGQEALAAFKAGEQEKGNSQKAAGQAAYEAGQAALKSFWANTKDQQAAFEADRAEAQKRVSAYLASLR